jgi:predicted secreted hydrolase
MRPLGALLVVIGTTLGCTAPYTDVPSADPANVTNFLGGTVEPGRFARARAPRRFVFPADHGPHPEFRTEWWYVTGNLATSEDRHFGFQLTFFRFALGAASQERRSRWAADQLWMAHFTVTDSAAGTFHAAEKFQRQALELAGARAQPFRVWLDDWSLSSAGPELFPITLTARSDEVALQLELEAGKPLVLQGDGGLDLKGPEPGNASYYYSFTRLPAAGQVTVDGRGVDVTGSAWFDREWSTSVLGPDIRGWDWFALQLDDGTDLMVYRLRRRDSTASPFSNGILVDASGAVSQRFSATDFTLTPTQYWRSPQSGARYTVGWDLAIPAQQIALTLRPRLRHQELDLAVRYWEGAMLASGERAGAPLAGVGYLEMVGAGVAGD